MIKRSARFAIWCKFAFLASLLVLAGCGATACSDATEALRILADQRKAEADKARAAARRAAASHDQRADAILAKPASVPGDDCKSASERASAWLAGRKP